jgi:hypothetical protein
VSSGKPSAQHRSGGPRPSAPSILATMRSAKPPCWRECRPVSTSISTHQPSF